MSTAVDYDKCRDCDTAISEVPTANAGVLTVSLRAAFNPRRPSRSSVRRVPYIQKARRDFSLFRNRTSVSRQP